MDSLEHIQDIARDDFARVRAWLRNAPDGQIVCNRNLGIAFGVLRLWDEAAEHLGALVNTEDITEDIQECLIISLFESRQYDKVVNVVASLDPHSLSPKLKFELKFLLGCAIQGKGDTTGIDKAIEAFEASHATAGILFPITPIRLHRLYASKGDMDGIIKIYETVVGKYPSLWWGWQLLCVASLAGRDINASVDVYRRAKEHGSETVKAWAAEGLRIVNLNNGIESEFSGPQSI